ncbi:MAG: peroxiredoxin family protein [Verrucomicrobiota bacterium]
MSALLLALALLADAVPGIAEEGVPAPAPGAKESETARPLEPGALAPDFTVRDAAGQAFHFDAERGKSPCLLVFWSIFCEPCRLQMAVVQNLYMKFRDAGLRVVAVSLDGEPLGKVVAGFAKQEGYAFPVLLDGPDDRGTFKVADPYGVSGMPSTFLVGRDGRIAARWVGFAKGEELEKAVQSSLRP